MIEIMFLELPETKLDLMSLHWTIGLRWPPKSNTASGMGSEDIFYQEDKDKNLALLGLLMILKGYEKDSIR